MFSTQASEQGGSSRSATLYGTPWYMRDPTLKRQPGNDPRVGMVAANRFTVDPSRCENCEFHEEHAHRLKWKARNMLHASQGLFNSMKLAEQRSAELLAENAELKAKLAAAEDAKEHSQRLLKEALDSRHATEDA
ncbi:hypothetical protein SLS55_010356 [Diplodia seriata]|uniref:BZIP domain-containing protein n=1 Tax=Diplodia seriata TaxID=420778 RepID=A0ABR3BYA4_9PEZI